MKIALVHDFLVKLGGAERVLKTLSEIYPKAPIFTLFYDEQKVGSVFQKERVITSSFQNFPYFMRKRYRLFSSKFPRLIEEFDFSDYDLVISSSTAMAHGIITPVGTKHLSYCHSPMRYAWDWTHEYRRENGLNGLMSLFAGPLIKYLREWDQLASKRPDMYVANSNNVKERIKKYYKRDSEIVHPPIDVKMLRAGNTHENFFLIVSTLSPYKRVDLAVELFNKIGRRLVIIGDGKHRKYLESIAGDNIDFLGFKSDEVVRDYMQNCRALIFPGEEDFGMTPLEAMASGKPVLAYGKGGCTESIISGKTGEFFFDQNVESMEDGLGRLLYNEKFYRPNTIRRHATQFSREIFEKKMQKMVRQCMK